METKKAFEVSARIRDAWRNFQGLKQSLKTMHPLYGLSKEKQAAYINSLDAVDKENLVKAADYYTKVIGGSLLLEED